MTPAKVMKAYADAGYACMAWQVWLMPWNKCGCGRRAKLRWRKGRYVYAWFRRPNEHYRSRCMCDECWKVIET